MPPSFQQQHSGPSTVPTGTALNRGRPMNRQRDRRENQENEGAAQMANNLKRRREVRVRLRGLQAQVAECSNRNELSIGSSKFEEILETANKLTTNPGVASDLKLREKLMDADVLDGLSQVLAHSTEALLRRHAATPEQFVAALRAKLGPMEAEAPKRRAQAVRRKRDVVGASVVPVQLNKQQGKEGDGAEGGSGSKETATEGTVKEMYRRLKRAPRHRVQLPQLLLSRTSFAHTVENMFALSFLVKEGRVGLTPDPTFGAAVDLRPPTEPASGSAQPKGQFIMRLDINDWKVNILYSGILPLTMLLWWMDVSQPQVRAWLHQLGLTGTTLAEGRMTLLVQLLQKPIELCGIGMRRLSESVRTVVENIAAIWQLKEATDARMRALGEQLEETRREVEEAERRRTVEWNAMREQVVERERELAAVRSELGEHRASLTERVEEVARRRAIDSRELRGLVEERERELAAMGMELMEHKLSMVAQMDEVQRRTGELLQLRGRVEESERELGAVRVEMSGFRRELGERERELAIMKGALVAVQGELAAVKGAVEEGQSEMMSALQGQQEVARRELAAAIEDFTEFKDSVTEQLDAAESWKEDSSQSDECLSKEEREEREAEVERAWEVS
ncbi:unnamed protein product [Closterium sp. NIES-65]|nr:unnamed protein product [Closterium sp. NIES-65]